MSTEVINNNLNILIDPTFTNVNRLFVLAYQNDAIRQSFSTFYLTRVLFKDFNVIIDKLAFFDLPIKTEECGPFTRLKERIKEFKRTGNINCIEMF